MKKSKQVVKDSDNTGNLKKKHLKNKSKKPYLSRKEVKEILREKRARLVLKNLPFKATEESIREHFQQYGEITNVELLKRPDGKAVGCAFIQFRLVQFAKMAQHYTNHQPFLGRKIKVDLAKPKDKYEKEKKKVEIKVKEEDVTVKTEDGITEVKDEEEDFDEETCEEQVPETRQLSFKSHDVNEGKTVFVKNLPFEATNGDLKQCMLQFGPVYYALVCVDKLTEHSKGTGFVKFVNKEDAEKALSAGTELTLLGSILDCNPAVDRDQLHNRTRLEKEEKKKPKDSRNLYLVKEGVILAGTKAAEGVSASDMAKRLQIEQYKTQMLRNLNTFLAKDRLVVHNLPASWDDRKLKILFEKHGGSGAAVREARVMRNMRQMDSKGVGESKQFGFVAFTRHENALAALRSLNNNPNVFTAQKRPIITFSIESKTALKAKIKRLEKSKLNNPKSKSCGPERAKKNTPENTVEGEDEVKAFTGITAKQGTVQKMRSRYKLTQQANLHYENLKKEKKKQKMSKKSLSEKTKNFIRQPKQKVNQKNQEDSFSKLVNDYKKKLVANMDGKKSKWYE